MSQEPVSIAPIGYLNVSIPEYKAMKEAGTLMKVKEVQDELREVYREILDAVPNTSNIVDMGFNSVSTHALIKALAERRGIDISNKTNGL